VGPFTSTPFTSAGIAQCSTITAGFDNSSCLENAFGGTPRPFQPVVGLYESGVISNSFRDWTDARGARHQNTAINTDSASSTDDLSLNVQWQPADDWYVNVDAHKTSSDFQQQQLWGVTNFYSDFSLSGVGQDSFPQITLVPDAGNNTFRRFRDGTVSGPDWTGATVAANPAAIPTDVSDPAANFLLSAADQFNDNEGEAWAVKGDVRREFDNDGWFDAIQFGGRISEREQTNQTAGLNWGSLSPAWAGEFGSTHAQVSESQVGGEVVDYSDFFGGGVFASGSQSEFVFIPTDVLADYDSFTQAIFTDPLLFVANGDTGFQNQVVNGGFVNPVTGETGVYSGSWTPLMQNGVVDYAGRGTTNSVIEETTAFYGRLDFGNEFDSGSSIQGNIGLRYVKATVSGEGGIDYVPITAGPSLIFTPEAVAFTNQADTTQTGEFNSVDHWLPSLNVKWNLNDESLIRFAASKNITRPNIAQLNPGRTRLAVQAFPTTLDPATGIQVVSDVINTSINEYGGNPNLLPVEAWNYDLGFEHYFGDDNYFSITGFYKDISNNITTDVETLEFVTLDGDDVPILFIGDQNQDTATFTGVEVAYQHFFDELPGLWSNFGLQANYTYIDANTNAPIAVVDTNGDGQPDSDERIYRFGVDNFLGTSAHTGNLVGIYQDDEFEFRLAYNYRSDFLVSYSDQITGNPIFVEGEGILDGSAKWDINDQFQVRLQVSNILGNETELYQQVDLAGQDFPRAKFKSDRRIKFGVRFQY
jgi:TonB-dependent receptor